MKKTSRFYAIASLLLLSIGLTLVQINFTSAKNYPNFHYYNRADYYSDVPLADQLSFFANYIQPKIEQCSGETSEDDYGDDFIYCANIDYVDRLRIGFLIGTEYYGKASDGVILLEDSQSPDQKIEENQTATGNINNPINSSIGSSSNNSTSSNNSQNNTNSNTTSSSTQSSTTNTTNNNGSVASPINSTTSASTTNPKPNSNSNTTTGPVVNSPLNASGINSTTPTTPATTSTTTPTTNTLSGNGFFQSITQSAISIIPNPNDQPGISINSPNINTISFLNPNLVQSIGNIVLNSQQLTQTVVNQSNDPNSTFNAVNANPKGIGTTTINQNLNFGAKAKDRDPNLKEPYSPVEFLLRNISNDQLEKNSGGANCGDLGSKTCKTAKEACVAESGAKLDDATIDAALLRSQSTKPNSKNLVKTNIAKRKEKCLQEYEQCMTNVQQNTIAAKDMQYTDITDKSIIPCLVNLEARKTINKFVRAGEKVEVPQELRKTISKNTLQDVLHQFSDRNKAEKIINSVQQPNWLELWIPLNENELKEAQSHPPASAPNPDELKPSICAGRGFGALTCILTRSGGYTLGQSATFLEKMLATNPKFVEAFKEDSKNFINIANYIMIVFLIVTVIANIANYKLDFFGLKKAIPRLIIIAILVNLSFIIIAIAVDLSNIIGIGIGDSFKGTLFGRDVGHALTEITKNTLVFTTLIGSGFVFIGVALAMLGPIIVGGLAAILTILVSLAIKDLIIIGALLFSPIAFTLLLFNRQKMFKTWLKMTITAIMFFPIVAAIFAVSKAAFNIVFELVESPITKLLAFGIFFIPMIVVPKLMLQLMNSIPGIGDSLAKAVGSSTGKAVSAYKNSDLHKGLEKRRKAQLENEKRIKSRSKNPYRRLRSWTYRNVIAKIPGGIGASVSGSAFDPEVQKKIKDDANNMEYDQVLDNINRAINYDQFNSEELLSSLLKGSELGKVSFEQIAVGVSKIMARGDLDQIYINNLAWKMSTNLMAKGHFFEAGQIQNAVKENGNFIVNDNIDEMIKISSIQNRINALKNTKSPGPSTKSQLANLHQELTTSLGTAFQAPTDHQTKVKLTQETIYKAGNLAELNFNLKGRSNEINTIEAEAAKQAVSKGSKDLWTNRLKNIRNTDTRDQLEKINNAKP